ncbi:uncharacterized protein LOC110443361 [Mizuhopecten yessoensis]|uniref:Protein GAMETE EXPRESSED 1 n=1 Tax=Mizuhopecten yessoensis TaxID=6573 RepID=A0A210PF74_MIZYE|nr:uncharacterized protein LOC110443361 [Mizuhopecten yessoensis]OWF35096.1 Protein GAMETE EXPRESSED 1 [Mizuhopecten yessoensis]
MHQVSFVLVFFNTLLFCTCGPGFADVDRSKYEDGKSRFEVIDSQARLPKYGQCWQSAIAVIQKGCKQLTHIVQNRLALAYLNCFLEDQGRLTYPCDVEESISSCTKHMSDVDRGSFTTFFTYTQNICYFLESQIWHQETEQTITRLAHSSENVADRLEESSKLQEAMIGQQNLTLQNQEIILDKAANLSDIISTSSDNMHELYTEFKKSTIEQKLLINDMFDKVTKLQTMVLGEFSGFYSMIYYTVSVIMSYLLTSSQRTASARFWLFGILTIGIIAERAMVSILNGASSFHVDIPMETDLEEMVYTNQWLCRKVCGGLALVILAIFAYRYRDINTINNELLMDIKRQNSELRQYLLNTTPTGTFGLKNQEFSNSQSSMLTSSSPLAVAADSTGYETDSAVSDCSYFTDTESVTTGTDHTFQPALTNWEDSENETCSSVTPSDISRITQQVTDFGKPCSDLPLNIDTWAKTGFYRHSTPIAKNNGSDLDSSIAESVKQRRNRSQTPEQCTSDTTPRYCFRPRTRRLNDNPVTRSESPRTFSRVVKQLERIAVTNSMLATTYTIKRKSNISDVSDYDGGEHR